MTKNHISNALQWRIQYQRVVMLDKAVQGIGKVIDKVTRQ